MQTDYVIMMLLILAVIYLTAIASIQRVSRRNRGALKSSLAYLKDIPEISWVMFNRNRVYLGFNQEVSDMGAICRGAAVAGNRVFKYGVHVYAVDGHKGTWRSAKRYCFATARRGRITRSNC